VAAVSLVDIGALDLAPHEPFGASNGSMRKIDGWKTLATKPIDQPIDLAA
jgi:hypothetical protein